MIFSTFHSHTQKAPVMITGFVEDHGASFFKSIVYRISSEEKIYHYSIAFGL